MYKRLYFTLPDVSHAQALVNELTTAGINRRHIHALARDSVDLGDLPLATPRQSHDLAHRLEHWFWRANLTVFFLALAGFLIGLAGEPGALAVLLLAVMIVTLVAGILWTRVPDTDLREFHDALSHREVLLMVDVNPLKVHDVVRKVQSAHPEAIPGGATWTLDAFGL